MNTRPTLLLTGGVGFIGTNLAHFLIQKGYSVILYDNLSRKGVEQNLDWLISRHPQNLTFIRGDVRDATTLNRLAAQAQGVIHLAAQVAVTHSLVDPVYDFEVNARGTLNVLEALRALKTPPPIIYTSTNKVLGGLESISLVEKEKRYEPQNEIIKNKGINEDFGIDFCSPYGCSKGAADQYVLDYSRNFGIPGVVFRMSCIYGPHQCGNEDQGWVAHFVKQAVNQQPIVFYGDGKQVRDALYIEDLAHAFHTALTQIDNVKSQAFNMGGGPENTTSLIELVEYLSKLKGEILEIKKEAWRPSDQRYYVSNISKFQSLTGWAPKVDIVTGLARLYDWFVQPEKSHSQSMSFSQRSIAS